MAELAAVQFTRLRKRCKRRRAGGFRPGGGRTARSAAAAQPAKRISAIGQKAHYRRLALYSRRWLVEHHVYQYRIGPRPSVSFRLSLAPRPDRQRAPWTGSPWPGDRDKRSVQ